MTSPEPPVDESGHAPRAPRSRLGIALVVGGYIIPLAVAAILLFILGDYVIGIALVLVETITSAAIHVTLRRPAPRERVTRLPGEPILGLPGDIPRGASGRAAFQVGAAMIGVVLALAVVAVIASHFG